MPHVELGKKVGTQLFFALSSLLLLKVKRFWQAPLRFPSPRIFGTIEKAAFSSCSFFYHARHPKILVYCDYQEDSWFLDDDRP